MPDGSEIVIEVEGVDVSRDVIYSSATFEAQMAAVPGPFNIIVKDVDRTYEFVSGDEVTLDVDGVRLYGGYALQPVKAYAFPADRTDDLDEVKGRLWKLAGPDYNFLLDKRVLRDTVNPTKAIPTTGGPITDGEVIRTLFGTYFDIPPGFDFTDAAFVLDNHTFPNGYTFPTQGTKMRAVLEDLAQYGSVYYLAADKKLRFLPVQETMAPWGFSDRPNRLPIGVGSPPTIGFRDGDATDDATAIGNDALVWGGSQWAGNGDVVFARRENATSIAAHKRWQVSENRVGDDKYKIQAEVDARAKVIVDGNESGTFAEGSKGLVNPEKQFRATWFSHNVPLEDGVHRHLLPGEVVPIELQVFDYEFTVPMRQARITFPTLDPKTDPSTAYVKFEGFFGVLMSDPYWLWAYLRQNQGARTVVVTANDTSVNPPHGAFYQGVPTPAPDGANKDFFIPFPYVAGSYHLFVDGKIKSRGTFYNESDPAAGKITFDVAPAIGAELYADAILRGGEV